jgi:nucleotide-binding universal stress UspA family protein
MKEQVMSYRKILVPIGGVEDDQAALQSALGLAKLFGAYAEALFVRPNPVTVLPYGYIGGDVSGYAAQYAIEAAIKAADEAQKRARAAFDKVIDKLHIPLAARPGAETEATSSFSVVEGDFVQEVERKSRLSDLIVFGAKASDGAGATIREGFEGALLGGARPVVFIPEGSAEIPGQRIAIAFDGSAAAAHAVTAALPFLARAKELHAFEVTSEKSTALADLQDYLSLRGLAVTPHAIDPGLKSAGEALVMAALGKKCDMMVQGGYGHSRLGEFVFGGVTRHVLKSGAPLAILMAH